MDFTSCRYLQRVRHKPFRLGNLNFLLEGETLGCTQGHTVKNVLVFSVPPGHVSRHKSTSALVYAAPPPPPPPPPPTQRQQSSNRGVHHFNMQIDADRRKTYETWQVPFAYTNHLAAAEFYFRNWSDVVRCAFCGIEVGHWKESDDVFKDPQRWSPSCLFVKALFV